MRECDNRIGKTLDERDGQHSDHDVQRRNRRQDRVVMRLSSLKETVQNSTT